ncbi:MAG: histidine phosphatase family protein [Chloroflexi bacterium]|nr:histidine phosphatase family protein [Chloroflexota bacterium]
MQPEYADGMTRLFLIRHGETEYNRQERLAGRRDDVLTALGHVQASALGRWLASSPPIDVMYASSLRRTHQTVARVCEQLARPPSLQIDSSFNEMHFGEAEGLTIPEILERFPTLAPYLASVEPGQPDWQWPGGDWRVSYYQRVVERIRLLVQQHPGQRVAVFTHGGVINGMLTWMERNLLGFTAQYVVPNCSVTEIIARDQQLSLVSLPQTPWQEFLEALK